jgi:GAF domain-containing protein
MNKEQAYEDLIPRINRMLEGERDLVTALSTVVCELYHGMDYFDWTGFYRVRAPGLLKVGPYQGGHGCLTITFDRGVCGKCAREAKTQIVQDVRQLPYHIACSSSTLSEIVVPVLDEKRQVWGVLDVDSDKLAAFDEVDAKYLEQVCNAVAPVFRATASAQPCV